MNKKEIGALFKAQRQESGFTQEKVEEITGVTGRTIRSVENGKTDMKMSTATALYDAYGWEVIFRPKTPLRERGELLWVA